MTARILVIEDHSANMELMTYLLRAFGYATLEAYDGGEGLDIAAREHPDLIVCDVQMPKMNGFEVARAIRSSTALRGIPLIAVTALAMAEDRERILAAGFDGYIDKPIAPETFVQEVQAFLRPEQRAAVAPASPATSGASTAPPGGRTVLVVDDKPVNLQLGRSLLEGSGYRVTAALTMGDALHILREAVPDLILSDVCMAHESGYDFIKAVKAMPRLRAVPFVFVTSTMTDESERRKGLALGAARFLFRPIEPQELLREIEACLVEARKA